MTVNTFAEQIRTEIDNRVAAAAGQVSDTDRAQWESEKRYEAIHQIRGYEIWVQRGRLAPLSLAQCVAEAGGEAMYITGANQYRTDGSVNAKEALGFLKDWATSLVQLDTAAIGAIGLFVGFSNLAQSPIVGIGNLDHFTARIGVAEASCIVLSTLSFFVSLFYGLSLLNALPGAAQRVPVNHGAMRNDVFSIANGGRFWYLTINTMSGWLRAGFLFGAFFFAAFIVLGLWRVAMTGNSGLSGAG